MPKYGMHQDLFDAYVAERADPNLTTTTEYARRLADYQTWQKGGPDVKLQQSQVERLNEPVYEDRGVTDLTPKGLDRLIDDEGNKLKVYRDTKKLRTIGVGFNLEDEGNRSTMKELLGFGDAEVNQILEGTRQITKEQSRKLLTHTVSAAQKDAQSLFPEFDSYPADVQDALTNLTFNMGKTTFSKFVRTIDAIKRRDGKAAASGLMQSLYAKQVGARAERIAEVLSQQLVAPETTNTEKK